MKRSIIFFLIIMSVLHIVSASTPDFEVTKLLDTEVKNGNLTIGELLFIEKPYIPENHDMSVIESNTFQQYDVLDWGGESVKILNPQFDEQILVSGSSYYFDRIGTYTIQSMTNSSNLDTILITSADDNDINITDIDAPKGFDLKFEEDDFELDDEEVIGVKLNVDDDVKKGDYKLGFKINEDDYEHNFKVIENVNWTIEKNISTKCVIKSGDMKYLGRVTLENTGNTDVEIVITKSGNESGMISKPKDQTLYRKNSLNLDFQISVPIIMKPGLYEMLIKIKSKDREEEIPINITVVDSIEPTIDSIDFTSENVEVDNEVRVYATDNNDVSNVTIEFDGNTYGMKKYGNLFVRTFKFTKISKYIFKICASDNQDNKICQTINRTFTKVDVIDGNKKVLNMNSMRYGKYSRVELFNITKDLESDIVLELLEYSKTPEIEEEPTFRIVDEEGSIKTFGKYNNEVEIEDNGTYYFEVRADKEVSITGVLRANIPEQYEEIQDITFNVEFKDYDVPQDFEIDWVDGRDVVCKVEDTGNLDTSYYDCELTFPIDTRPESISIPTTVKERSLFEDQTKKVREELDGYKSKSGWIIAVMVGLVFIVLLWAGFMILLYPYIRFKVGKMK